MAKPKTRGELAKSGYVSLSVKQELRKNLIRKMQKEEQIFPGIVGYEETVIPQVENAILSGQDIIFLGERGQAKSRLIRAMVNILDEELPIIAGSEVNDDPFNPISRYGQDIVAEKGDGTPIVWIDRERRYGEKLSTPDITVADLIGEVDPIKVAEGRYLADELTIHYGLIPRTNRGIFAINELPDLAERIQVGLFNIMEDRDVQIKGYRIRLPLDICLIASANPEDYTNRGRIITPLKDRFGAHIRTHYPRTVEQEIDIMEQEREHFEDTGLPISVPRFMKEILAEISALARRSPDVNQRSGVSVRVSIGNYETSVSNALRRAIRNNESEAAPRVSDLAYILASTTGKIELESVEEGKESRVIEDLIKRGVLNVFNRYFTVHEFDGLLRRFEEGLVVEASDMLPARHYTATLGEMEGLGEAVKRLEADESPATVASAIEFVLEGLHLNRRVNKDKHEGAVRYRG
ncbi:MAG: magnesium chelatase [Chloroflexi bacterium]|nr:magnesium chelatase [Chloroflexota bacterium]